ncbi:Hypothetical protein, putative [Bodo saltans]|uniref:Uncharacterized protein n=1 Tax=Bodo saltans TaxID=75058 RepID=A0A0S4IQ56_BODSA|nr:Hypothetical protein, putative [Bodo saltans]|eukprot:CUF93232.1 Hypothetical protein, putative [Bodo saltans]
MMSPPSETGVLPPPPSLMATYFLAHQSREARASGTERLSSRENELAVHHRRAVGNDGRWPQDTIGKQPQPPGGAQGVAHMSLGTMNNFDWWPNGSGLPAAASQQRPTAGAGSPQQPLLGRAVHQDHVDQMIEAQDIATKLHPARAALLGQYYHDIAKEKLAATHALASEYHHQHSNVVDHRTSRQLGTGDIVTPHLHHSHHSPPSVPSMLASLNVGQRLDAEFPLRGLTWSSHASGHHHDNLTHHHRESGADFQELNGGGDVLARLTKHHCEQPAISLYRLQQQLTLLESSKQSFEEHVQKQRNKNKSEQSLLLTSTQRLHRFRNAASATTQQTSLHVKDSARPNSLADRNKRIHKVTQRPASAQY